MDLSQDPHETRNLDDTEMNLTQESSKSNNLTALKWIWFNKTPKALSKPKIIKID